MQAKSNSICSFVDK